MSDHNRGAYTPQSEAPLAFDARRTRGGERPFPMALIISAAILALIVIALVVFLMRQPDGTVEGPDGGTTIDAMKAPPPVAAVPVTAPPPGMQVVTEDNLVAPSFAPPPEQPGARPTTTTPATAADPVGALTVAPKAPVAAAAPKAAPAPVAPAASGGAVMVQIGAFSSPAAAEKGWNDVAALLPGQMAGKTKRVEQIAANGATLHRAFIGGFGSRADADAFCTTLRTRGRQCLVR